MSPLVKHLCSIRNKNQSLTNENLILQEKINKLIRENQIHEVFLKKQKYDKGSKGWWQITNKISGRKAQNVHVCSIIDPQEINNFLQSINTDDTYVAPERMMIREDTYIPTVGEQDVWDLLVHQKRTVSGPDNLPYWLWRDFAHHLAPIITKIFNNSICKQEVPHLWKIADVVPIPTRIM